MNQSKAMRLFNEKYREDFNPELFKRSEDDIIEELKKVILSCQRDRSFIIRVDGFRVIEDYDEINDILYKYEEEQKSKSKGKKKDNVYEYINLKDSDIKLLLVDYYLEAKNDRPETEKELKHTNLTVIIAVPRVVNKYYFRIGGNNYSAMYQIVDGSTYNNSTSSNTKTHSITMKNVFMPVRIYRNKFNLETSDGETIQAIIYRSKIFNKSISVMKYIFAKFGLLGGLKLFGVGDIHVSKCEIEDPEFYSFQKHDLYINVPKVLFEDHVVQSLVCTIYESIMKDTKHDNIFKRSFWLRTLGGVYTTTFTEEKGEAFLDSLEKIYDQSTKEGIRLPEEHKKDIYHILRWMCREFSELKMKDNLDVSIKNIRWAQYIASLYAMKLSKGIYRISDRGKKVDLDAICKVVTTSPNYLLTAITKCALVNYRNSVNDNDAFSALKFTYKGVAGIGEKTTSVPDIYRTVHHSHLGRVDLDSSSASDPGMSGMICPLTKLYDKSFSDYEEPNTWEEQFSKLMDEYHKVSGKKQMLDFKESVLGQEVDKSNVVDSLNSMRLLVDTVYRAEKESFNTSIFNLEDGGFIVYE